MLTSINTLDYRSSAKHKLSFELLIDGKPIGSVVGSSDTAIPYWLFQTGVALSPLNNLESHAEKRVIAVCSCGSYGCSCVQCNVTQSWDGNILFRDFTIDQYHSDNAFNMLMFTFSSVNYDFVVTKIYQEIKALNIT